MGNLGARYSHRTRNLHIRLNNHTIYSNKHTYEELIKADFLIRHPDPNNIFGEAWQCIAEIDEHTGDIMLCMHEIHLQTGNVRQDVVAYATVVIHDQQLTYPEAIYVGRTNVITNENEVDVLEMFKDPLSGQIFALESNTAFDYMLMRRKVVSPFHKNRVYQLNIPESG